MVCHAAACSYNAGRPAMGSDTVTPGCGICPSLFCLSRCSLPGIPKMLVHYRGAEASASILVLHAEACSQFCKITWLWWREVTIIKVTYVPLFYSQFSFPCSLSNLHVIIYLLFLFSTLTSLNVTDFSFSYTTLEALFLALPCLVCFSTLPFSVLTLSVLHRISNGSRNLPMGA